MADDTSYSTFLAKANADPNSGQPSKTDTPSTQSTSQARSRFDPTTSSGPESGIPAALQNLPSTPYVSDTDSDWEPVFFSYAADTLPDQAEFERVLAAKNGSAGQGVEELTLAEFDPRGSYAEVVERVRTVGREEARACGDRGKLDEGEDASGSVKVFRVQVSATRVEYYVLTVGERKLVGVVAKAVES